MFVGLILAYVLWYSRACASFLYSSFGVYNCVGNMNVKITLARRGNIRYIIIKQGKRSNERNCNGLQLASNLGL